MAEEIKERKVDASANQKAGNDGEKNKKKLKISDFVIIGLIAAAVIYMGWNYLLAPKHSIQVNDTEISLRNTVQELLDEGFVLCSVTGEVNGYMSASVKAKEVYKKTYYIGVPKYAGASSAYVSGLELTLANFDSKDKKLSECSIYQIKYYPGFQDQGAKVLIDGEDMKEVSSWKKVGNESGDGTQIDLVIKRRDRVIDLCEIKFVSDEFEITKEYEQRLRNKVSAFLEATGTRDTLQTVMITTYGVKKNKYGNIVSKEVLMDDLFEEV